MFPLQGVYPIFAVPDTVLFCSLWTPDREMVPNGGLQTHRFI